MSYFLNVVFFVLVFMAAILVDRFVIHLDRSTDRKPANPLPADLSALSADEHRCLSLYLEEWKLVIQTQMHFNDIVLRFRTLALTAFVTLIAAIIALSKIATLNRPTVILLMCMPLILWTAAGALDYLYYHRLLLGAVTQAAKFDGSELAKRYGLFGMTTCISESIHVPTSNVLVVAYYTLPGLLTAIILGINFFSS